MAVERFSDDEPEEQEFRIRGSIPLWAFVLFEFGLAPLGLVFGRFLKQSPLEKASWDTDAMLWGVAASAPMILLMALAARWPIGPIGRIRAFLDRELAPILKSCEVPDLALVSLAAGVGEEIFFRGLIQGVLTRYLGPIFGISLASLIFGLLHPVTPTYIVIAGVLGAYLGTIYFFSGQLLTVIVAHTIYDFVTLLVFVDSQKKTEESDD